MADLTDLYEEATDSRAIALAAEAAATDPDLRMSILLDRLVEKQVAVMGVLQSGLLAEGWEDDIRALREMASRWAHLADALRLVEDRCHAAANMNGGC